jgi:DNA-binding response OmpR family regulator
VDPLVPVITVTGAIDVVEVRALCEAGADAVLPRPILLRRLYLAVVDAMDRSCGACAPTQGRGQKAEAQ